MQAKLFSSAQLKRQEQLQKVTKFNTHQQTYIFKERKEIFNFYDLDGMNKIFYQEFVSVIFGTNTGTTRNYSPKKVHSAQLSQQGGNDLLVDTIDKLRTQLALRGSYGLIGLGKQFKLSDKNNTKILDYNQFSECLLSYRVDLKGPEIQSIFNFFDKKQNNTVNYEAFLRGVRGPLNAFRRSLVQQAFDLLDQNRTGIVQTNVIQDIFNASGHPEIKKGKKTEDDVLTEFLQTFGTYLNNNDITDSQISFDEFLDYYTFISASIDNDQYFEMLMQNAWKMYKPQKRTYIQQRRYQKQQQQDYENLQYSHVQRNQSYQTYVPENISQNKHVELILKRIRSRLAPRGAKCFIGLHRQFSTMDLKMDGTISLRDFIRSLKDYRVEITEQDIHLLLNSYNQGRQDGLNYNNFMKSLLGQMNEMRKKLVDNLFSKMDSQKQGVFDIEELKIRFDPTGHPEVLSNKKTKGNIFVEFADSLILFYELLTGKKEGNMNYNQFVNFFTIISATIRGDDYFEMYIQNTFGLLSVTPRKYIYAGGGGGREQSFSTKNGYINDFHRGFGQGGTVTQNAPFGTNESPMVWSTSLRPNTSQGFNDSQVRNNYGRQQKLRAGNRTFKKQSIKPQTAQKHYQSLVQNELLNKFRETIYQRGPRGVFSLSRLFQLLDKGKSGSINLSQFQKVCKDFRVGLKNRDVSLLFDMFDVNDNGLIEFQEFVNILQGSMNKTREDLCIKAYNHLDKKDLGFLDFDDVLCYYNAKAHPDVKNKRRSEEEILSEFLDTFEQHHTYYTNNEKLGEKKVTEKEFICYYKCISCSIDDDRYFKNLIESCWGIKRSMSRTNYGKFY